MADRNTAPSPPPTEVLPGQRRDIRPEDLAPSQGELANQPNPTPDEGGVVQQPPVPTEPLDQPGFTIDEPGGEPPGEPTAPTEPERDPLKDTQAAYHEARQEIAKLKEMMQALATSQQLSAPGPQAPTQPQGISQEFFDPQPTQQELQDPRYPMNYVQRMRAIDKYERDQVEMQRLMTENPDWTEHLSTMQQIKAEDPYGYEGAGAFGRLLRRAKERKELDTLRQKHKEIADKSLAAGAQMQRSRANQPFAPPKAGGGIPQSGNVPPADFANWDTAKQRQWLVEHGLVRDE